MNKYMLVYQTIQKRAIQEKHVLSKSTDFKIDFWAIKKSKKKNFGNFGNFDSF